MPRKKARVCRKTTRQSSVSTAADSSVPDSVCEVEVATESYFTNNLTSHLVQKEIEEPEWRKGKSLNECHTYMLKNQVMCDVNFALGPNEERFGAHKYMLIAVSDIFFLMFCGPMAEQSSLIKIPDVQLNTFKSFLTFIYAGSLDTTPDTVMELLYVAKKYNVESLIRALIQNIEDGMSHEDVCVVLEQAHMFNVPYLEKAALTFIEDHPAEVLKSNHVESLCADCLRKVLSSDDLQINLNPSRDLWETEKKSEAAELEKMVLMCALTWAKNQCKEYNLEPNFENKRKVLGDMIWLIRFIQLDPKYFVDEVSKMDILTVEERCSFLENMVVSEKVQKTAKRRGPHQNMISVSRFRSISENLSMDNRFYHSVSFKCSKEIYMHGIVFYGSSKGKSCKYNVELKLCQGENSIAELATVISDIIDNFHIHSKHGSVCLRIPDGEYRVLFHRKVLLQQDVLYTIVLDLIGPSTYCGVKGRSEICFYTGGFWKIEFENGPYDCSKTSTEKGQIPYLLLSSP